MKTTLVLGDELVRELKEMAVRQSRSMSAIVDEALRSYLHRSEPLAGFSLPAYDAGLPRVDVADREQLWTVLDAKTGQ